jgi:hypothetical protein
MATWSGYPPPRRSRSRSPERRGGGAPRYPDYPAGGSYDRAREWDRPGGGGDVWGRERDIYELERERADWEFRRANGLPMRGRSSSPAYGDG